MYADDRYRLKTLVKKFGLPAAQIELGLRRADARSRHDQDGRSAYTYEAVWQYVHTCLNHERFAAWEHNVERVRASELSDELVGQLTSGWPEKSREKLLDLLGSANGSTEVCLLRHRVLHIDPECPSCGGFPWIVGFDGRGADAGIVLSIYACPACGYLFLKR